MINDTKIKNSETCPCGSGKIFSKCCKFMIVQGGKKQKEFKSAGQLNATIQKVLKDNRPKLCLHPVKEECSKEIKGAHTLQNNGVLSLLAEDNHVIIPELGVDFDGAIIDLVNKGRNRVTKYTCFCDYHDSVLFAPIETQELDYSSREQCFLFAFRSFAMEYYKKLVSFRVMQKSIKENPIVLTSPEFVLNYRGHLASQNDVTQIMDIFSVAIVERSYDVITTYIRSFDYQFSIAAAFSFSPCFDLEGNELCLEHLTSLTDKRLPILLISIIPEQERSNILISYLTEDHDVFAEFINQINNLTDQEVKCMFNNLIPEYSEEFVIAPKLWERFSPHMKHLLEEKMIGNVQGEGHQSLARKANLLDSPGYNLFRQF